MGRYRKKPVVIDAWQFNNRMDNDPPNWLRELEGKMIKVFKDRFGNATVIDVRTLEGIRMAVPGDWIIRGVKGEIYPCKPDIFEATYEEVDP
jgi:hypothetical protein